MTQQQPNNSRSKGIDITRARYRKDARPVMQPHSKENHWLPLHRYAVDHAEGWSPCFACRWYFEEWKPAIPIFGCACGKHWAELTEQYPPDFSSPRAFFEWGWARHNDVSTLHSKRPLITLEEAYAIYWS